MIDPSNAVNICIAFNKGYNAGVKKTKETTVMKTLKLLMVTAVILLFSGAVNAYGGGGHICFIINNQWICF